MNTPPPSLHDVLSPHHQHVLKHTKAEPHIFHGMTFNQVTVGEMWNVMSPEHHKVHMENVNKLWVIVCHECRNTLFARDKLVFKLWVPNWKCGYDPQHPLSWENWEPIHQMYCSSYKAL
jgi:hypothetical protein